MINARDMDPFERSNVVYIGSTRDVLACMFPECAEAHVVQYRRWKFLYAHGIVDAAGVTLVGRLRGQRFISER